MSNLFEVDVHLDYNHRVFFIADSEEDAMNKAWKLENTPDIDKMFQGECCTKEFVVIQAIESSKENYMDDSEDVMFIGKDGLLRSKHDFNNLVSNGE